MASLLLAPPLAFAFASLRFAPLLLVVALLGAGAGLAGTLVGGFASVALPVYPRIAALFAAAAQPVALALVCAAAVEWWHASLC